MVNIFLLHALRGQQLTLGLADSANDKPTTTPSPRGAGIVHRGAVVVKKAVLSSRVAAPTASPARGCAWTVRAARAACASSWYPRGDEVLAAIDVYALV